MSMGVCTALPGQASPPFIALLWSFAVMLGTNKNLYPLSCYSARLQRTFKILS